MSSLASLSSGLAIAGALALLGAAPVFAQTAATQLPGVNAPAGEVALSNRTMDLSYLTSAKGLSLTNSQLSGGIFLSEDRDVVGTIGVLVPTDLSIGSFITLDVGPRAYLGLMRNENEDVTAIALGVQARVDLLRNRELAVVGSAYYAPDVLTFGAGDNIKDLAARAEMRLTRRAVGFAGWRWFDINEPGPNDRTLQDEFIAGIRWRFE